MGLADPGRHNGRVLSPAIENLVAQLTRLPGVGSRTAHRLAFHLLRTDKDEALALAGAHPTRRRTKSCARVGAGSRPPDGAA